MNNPRLAGRYAKSLLDLSIEQNSLQAVIADMKLLAQICKSNSDFVSMLKSPVIASDKKQSIIESITADKVSNITTLFIRLLVAKTRESNLPEITKAFIEQYNAMNNIHQVKFTTATPISTELQDEIVNKIKSDKALQSIELETGIDESLIGGFKLQLGDTLVDASISRDLQDIKRQFLNNDYIHKLR
ncbi:ATP synthase F1 subunit delta [Ferruginibacter sp. HRS2-29]|uniref:ATP synthase F1 subunit delta n=2 Tax=Ferruginibacter sp. HRS2-29 TaxID=2487334 RepID=UPI0020CFCB84|nr:ATP synthase F1 subunit delta [Ferruginibacter sp. HRS2-29]MCP9751632.1 ATP synthase F1 subunit delta [Ferruginibacter sp. HRS2-29]